MKQTSLSRADTRSLASDTPASTLLRSPALAQDQSDDNGETSIEMPDAAATEEAPPDENMQDSAPDTQPAEPTAVPVAPPASGVQEVQVTLRDDFTLTVSPSTIRAGRVRVVVTNEGRMTHGLGIVGLGLEQFVSPGSTLTQENPMQARTYTLYCPVADHADRGMRAQLVVQ